MTIETIILVLLGILCIVGILFSTYLANYLKKNHADVWDALGSPSLFTNNSIKNNWLFIKFLFKRLISSACLIRFSGQGCFCNSKISCTLLGTHE